MAVFRPSARARLQLRLDEGVDTEPGDNRLERDPPDGATVQDTVPTTELGRQEELSQNRARRRLVVRERASLSPTELSARTGRLDTRRNALQLGGEGDQSRPQGLATLDVDDRTLGVDLVPLSCRIMRNGIMSAAEAELEFDARRLPIDPRILRSVFLDLVIGTVSAESFELGVNGAGREDGSRLSTIDRIPGQELKFGTTTRFVGYVDEWDTGQDENGDTIVIKARDMTAPLIDTKLPTGATINLGLPLADGVAELVNRFPATRGMDVIFGDPGSEEDRVLAGLPAVSPFPASRGDRGPMPLDAVPRPRKARRGSQAKRAKSGDTAMTVWDHIVDTVVATGFIPIIRGLRLYLIEPRTFYESESNAKKIVYGRNLIDLHIARKLGGIAQVPTVEVRCPDPEIGRTRWARAPLAPGQEAFGVFGINDPPKANRANRYSPGGSTSEEIKVIDIAGISDGGTLARIARSLFEQIGRQEIEGSWSTSDITSLDSDEEGDLLDLQPGDAVEVLIAPLNAASNQDSTNQADGGSVNSAQEISTMILQRRVRFLQSVGIPEDTAIRLALAQEQTELVTTFRVQDVTITWSQEDGLSLEGDFINFLVVREDTVVSQQAASGDVLQQTAGSTSLASEAMQQTSAAGNTLGRQAQKGEIGPDEYASKSTDERGRQQRATQAQRRSG